MVNSHHTTTCCSYTRHEIPSLKQELPAKAIKERGEKCHKSQEIMKTAIIRVNEQPSAVERATLIYLNMGRGAHYQKHGGDDLARSPFLSTSSGLRIDPLHILQ